MFCSKPPAGFDKIRMPKKATTLKEYYNNEIKSKMKVHNQYLSIWINITIPESNQEATLYILELTSTLPIRKLIQVYL